VDLSDVKGQKAFYRSLFLAGIGKLPPGLAPGRSSIRSKEREVRLLGTILVVDDDESTREFVYSVLTGKHYRLVTAGTVDDAIVHLHSHLDMSLVVSDLRMPDKDGFVLLEYVRSNLRFAHIPVIVITSVPFSPHVAQALKMGARDFIAKPVDEESLLTRIRRVLEASRCTVLLVTDCPTTTTIMSNITGPAGIALFTADSGAKARDILRQQTVDIVISEMALSDATGLDLLMQAADIRVGIPVLFIADPHISVSESELVSAGAHGLVQRPLNGREILRKITWTKLSK
jgi:DNA-binding NtrC family response regulator